MRSSRLEAHARPAARWRARLAASALLWAGVSCGESSGSNVADPGRALTGRLDLTRTEAWVAVEGAARVGRDAWLTSWFGRESAPGAPALLGDERVALIVQTPSRVRCPLPAATAARTFRAAVRRESAGSALRAEVFFQAPGEAPRSLTAVELGADPSPWQEVAADLPTAAGDLWLVARRASSAVADQPAGVLAWGAPTVAPASAPDLPDLIVITVDTLRADAMDALPSTRALFGAGEWAAAGLAPSNWTLPSFASLWTGLPADQHGAGRTAFPSETPGASASAARDYTMLGAHPTVPESLHAAGWATACFHQNPFLESWTGLARGFDQWTRTADAPDAQRAPVETWWRAQAHRPRLLVLHFMRPHLPYGSEDEGDPLRALPWREFLASDATPEERRAFFDLSPAAREEVRRRYREEVAALDRELAAWLPALIATARRPAFVFFADHGEELWDAGSFEHGHGFDASVVRVPAGFAWREGGAPLAIPGPAPAGHLGLHLLHRLAESDRNLARTLERTGRGLPACAFAPGCPAHGKVPIASLRPLYRAEHDGVVVGRDGGLEFLPFTGAGSGGAAPALDAAVLERLRALGYAGLEPH